jgi:DNA-binding MarR family transcriptional regulator
MPVKLVFNNQLLRAWMLIHQTYNSISKCESKVYPTSGFTAQQHAILMAIKYADAPATPTQIANFVDRNVNSITLIVDRMQKKGLVKRVRDIGDRRSLRVAITRNGEKVLKQGTRLSWVLIQDVLSGLSEEEIQTLAVLLDKVKQGATNRCHPGKKLNEVKLEDRPRVSRLLKNAMHKME